MSTSGREVVVLAGGYGGAKFSHGLALAAQARAAIDGAPLLPIAVVVNTGDDLELHGLLVCPDLDTVMYTLAGLANEQTGWGLRNETWSGAAMLKRYGAETWFQLGDQDMATHLRRSDGVRSGRRLTEITAELASSLGVTVRLLPMSDDRVRTMIRTAAGWIEFQEYFVRDGQRDTVLEIRRDGIEEARPTREALEAIKNARLIVVAPSNPFVSVGTILALPGMVDTIATSEAAVVAVSPVVGGKALRGPADKMLESLGGRASASGVVEHYERTYPGLIDAFVIDTVDSEEAAALRSGGAEVMVLDTVMRTDRDRQRLAESLLEAYLPG